MREELEQLIQYIKNTTIFERLFFSLYVSH